jgi:hypothetical protein
MYTQETLRGALALGMAFIDNENDADLDSLVELLLREAPVSPALITALTESGKKVKDTSIKKMLVGRKLKRMVKELAELANETRDANG